LSSKGRGRGPAENPRITVINDNPEFLDLMNALLENNAGYDVTTIDGDTIIGIEPIRGSRPDLLIIDLRLRRDGLAGWDILLAIRKDAELAQLPIILCTGDLEGLREHAEAITDDPMVATLQKPFHLDELEALVRRFVGESVPA
jgi:CheY-like chemotaxis protein